MFVDACRKHGIRPGFYHGSVNNAFLNVRSAKVGAPTGIAGQAVLTEEEYFMVLLANLRQLWTDYGPLAEVWFDGTSHRTAHNDLRSSGDCTHDLPPLILCGFVSVEL